ncbi:MAG: hypothetical protein A2782_00915 [Candidatus Blackburnbacteria bacterium RIFCSPHIGHO2_01_FULL_43_15b]|uniref:Uncharacterized protein n=1 Tax=Candidatus Blackburnbacteria bacterium RIFCSPHIGHO2_01_FULL_43_15b TaxID=1797513 RepID=A0A1G1V0W6_9BACT|nr:MAG: hypothetical protein A2782_00915 [Candidatus Blackburnbacteria bacterium RIFCSPHIGHO2_01_FULL_43_15b]
MKENIYFLELRKSDEDTAVCTKSSITSAVINFGQRNNHEFCTSCHPEEWNDEGSLLSTARARTAEFVTMLGKLTPQDKEGHGQFKSDEGMHETYRRYYNQPVDSHTPLKIIRFMLN